MALASRLVLELGGTTITDLTSVSGLALDREVIELKQIGPDGEAIIRRVPGGWRPGEVRLTRLAGTDLTFHTWVQAGEVGPGAIVSFDGTGAVVRRYVLTSPWARRLEVSLGSEGGLATVTETLVVSYDRIDIQ